MAYFNRGDAYRQSGNLQNAIVDLTRAIEIDSKFAQAYVNRAVIQDELGNSEGAIEDLKKAAGSRHKRAQEFFESKGEEW